MFDFIGKLFNKKQPKNENYPSFVEKHILYNPKYVMANYCLWQNCKEIPVTMETKEPSVTGYVKAVNIPCTKETIDYLKALLKMSDDKIKQTKYRTVFFVKLSPSATLFLFPNLHNMSKPNMAYKGSENSSYTWFVTPQINKDIVELWKTYTR